MEKLLIMAYMGTGKTELENHYENVIGIHDQEHKYIYDESIRNLPYEQRKGTTHLRKENPEYPNNLLQDTVKLLNEGKIVLAPFIEHVFRAYNDANIKSQVENLRVILVCPGKDNFLEYVERFKRRGNSKEFISRRRKEFSSLVDLFFQANDYERILIKPGQYLSEALEEYGISLAKKY